MIEGLSFTNFEKAIQDRLIESATNICTNIKNECLCEMEKEFEKEFEIFKLSCERLVQKYSSKMEKEVQKKISSEIIQIAEDIHSYCENDIVRNETNVLIRIG